MKYLLDTDICIYALKGRTAVLEHFRSRDRWDIALSAITEAELRAGAAKSSSLTSTVRRVESFLRPLTIVEFSSADAIAYARVRSTLEQKGTPIGPLDTLIAAQAIARDLVLVSNNEREFARVTGLRLENWAA